MKQLDPIEEPYNMYSEEEDSPKIVEVIDNSIDFVSQTSFEPISTNAGSFLTI